MNITSIERLSVEDWDILVSSIYEAALNPRLWNDVLLAIGKPLNAHAGHLVMLSGNGTTCHYNNIVGLPTSVYAEFDQFIEEGLHTRLNAAQHFGPMTLLTDYMHTSERQMKRDPFYQGPAKEHDMEYYGGFILAHEYGCFTGLATLRSRRFGHLNDRESQLLRRLMPHLKRSVDLMQLLPQQGLLLGINEVLENLPIGAVIIDYRGRISGMNSKAKARLKLRDGIYESDNTLQVFDPQAKKKLVQEIKKIISATDYLDLKEAGYIQVPHTASCSHCVLFVTPIRKSIDPFRRVAGIVFIMDPREQLPEFKNQLVNVYALTPAEADLVQALCEGKTLKEIAAQQGVSVEAPRFHLKNIYTKIGVKRQAELIRTILRGLAAINH